jgi:DNA-binding LacI/PurR family transcriptional regulator
MDNQIIDLDEAWFCRVGVPDPVTAAAAWQQWLTASSRPRTAGARYREALRLATGLSRSAIGFYCTEKNRYQLSDETLALLDNLSAELGCPRQGSEPSPVRGARRSPSRIAVLTELKRIPSPRFHMELLAECARQLTDRNFLCTLHELRTEDHDMLTAEVERIARYLRPDGIILLRLTPQDALLQTLHETGIPAVLVHADDHEYGPPILANVIPNLKPLADGLRLWAQTLPQSTQPVVVVSMQPESEKSLRAERLRMIKTGLIGVQVQPCFVADFSFRQAAKVLDQYPEARGYVCLSDEIAVGIKHLLKAKGKDPKNQIIGYDDSRIAALEDISSFSQHLGDTVQYAVEALTAWLRHTSQAQNAEVSFNRIAVEVTWTPRT